MKNFQMKLNHEYILKINADREKQHCLLYKSISVITNNGKKKPKV